MVANAEKFKAADKEFSDKHTAKQELETYVQTVEQTISSPDFGAKMKRGQKGAIEQQLAAALEKLEMEDASGDELKKANLNLRRALQKAMSSR